MPHIKELTRETLKAKILLYGSSGVGKTYFLRTVPQPIHVLDFDGGLASLYGSGLDLTYDTLMDEKENGVLMVSGWKKALAILQDLETGKAPLPATLAVDSLTFMADCLHSYCIMKLRTKGNSFDVWNMMIADAIDFIFRLKRLDSHIVMTAHEEVMQREVDGGLYFIPSITTKALKPKIPGCFDEVWRLVVEANGKRVIKLQPHQDYIAESRLTIGVDSAEPNFGTILGDAIKM